MRYFLANGLFHSAIAQRDSLSPLEIRTEKLDLLINHCNISPKLRGFLAFFGRQHGETSLSPPVTFSHVKTEISGQLGNATNLASGKVLHKSVALIYILRIPETHSRDEPNAFSVRQFMVCHHNSSDRLAASLVTTGTAVMAQKWLSNFREFSGPTQELYWRFHLGLLELGVAAWRPYIAYISDQIDRKVRSVSSQLRLVLTSAVRCCCRNHQAW